MKFSLGKNYTSEDWLVINSEIWKIGRSVDFFGRRIWISHGVVPYVNLGLLYGEQKQQTRVAERHSDAERSMFGSHAMQDDSWAARARDFVRGLPDKKDEMLSWWIEVNRKLLSSVPEGMSWFVHPSLGGLGLPVTREVTITEGQRKLAAALWVEPSSELYHLMHPVRRLPQPAFLDRYLSARGELFDRLGVRYVRREPYWQEGDEEWEGFFEHTSCGFEATRDDARKNDEVFRKGWKRAWDLAQKTWAKPLSFHNCVEGHSGWRPVEMPTWDRTGGRGRYIPTPEPEPLSLWLQIQKRGSALSGMGLPQERGVDLLAKIASRI